MEARARPLVRSSARLLVQQGGEALPHESIVLDYQHQDSLGHKTDLDGIGTPRNLLPGTGRRKSPTPMLAVGLEVRVRVRGMDVRRWTQTPRRGSRGARPAFMASTN